MSAAAPAVEQRLTVPEAARAGCRHPVTIRKALEDGRLHGTQQVKGGRWAIRVSCLDAWLDGVKCEHQRPAATVTSLDEARGRRAS